MHGGGGCMVGVGAWWVECMVGVGAWWGWGGCMVGAC